MCIPVGRSGTPGWLPGVGGIVAALRGGFETPDLWNVCLGGWMASVVLQCTLMLSLHKAASRLLRHLPPPYLLLLLPLKIVPSCWVELPLLQSRFFLFSLSANAASITSATRSLFTHSHVGYSRFKISRLLLLSHNTKPFLMKSISVSCRNCCHNYLNFI